MSRMSQEPRIAPLPESEWDTTLTAATSAVGPLNVLTTLGRHPELFKAWIGNFEVKMKNAAQKLLVLLQGAKPAAPAAPPKPPEPSATRR